MSFTFYVPVASALLWQSAGLGDQPIDPTNLNKEVSDPSPTATDNTYRLAWGPGQRWRLKGTTGTVAVNHSGITQVRILARGFISNNGPFGWEFNEPAWVTERPYACPYFKWDGSHVKYAPDEWYGVPPGLPAQTFVGYDISDWHNFNQPGNPSPRVIQKDITTWSNDVGLGPWTNALLSNREFGLSMDEEVLAYNILAGRMPVPGPGGTAPRYNISQLILEVTANDPAPPPPTLGRTLILVSE